MTGDHASISEKKPFKVIHSRLPNEDDGGYLMFPALLVSESVAFAIFDDQLEVHLVKSTVDPDGSIYEKGKPIETSDGRAMTEGAFLEIQGFTLGILQDIAQKALR